MENAGWAPGRRTRLTCRGRCPPGDRESLPGPRSAAAAGSASGRRVAGHDRHPVQRGFGIESHAAIHFPFGVPLKTLNELKKASDSLEVSSACVGVPTASRYTRSEM
jgi:hypothetical protein